MPYHHRQNLYPGVNAHLQTFLPRSGKSDYSSWPSFHSDHITLLTGYLNRLLPAGYRALTEQALQISSIDLSSGMTSRSPVEPDSLIYRQWGANPPASNDSALMVATPTLQLTLDEAELDDFVPSVAIYYTPEDSDYGQLVTRIELLSPSNKPGSSAYFSYVQNRAKALRSGTALVEIDYFHQSATPVLSMLRQPRYPDPATYPYNVTLSIPQANGQISTQLFGFGVVAPFPVGLPIPLKWPAVLPCDLAIAYQQAYENGRWGDVVDYQQPLIASDLATFRADDQAALEALRQQIIHTHFGG